MTKLSNSCSCLTQYRRAHIIHSVVKTSDVGRGFTLVELLVVISVLGIILAFFVPPMVSRITTASRKTATVQEMNVLRDAIMGTPEVRVAGELVAVGFKQDVGRLPRNLIELATKNPFIGIYENIQYLGKESLPTWDPYLQRGWNGPYIREDGRLSYLYDAWGAPYRFLMEGADTVGLESPGPDGLFWGQPGSLVDDDIRVRF